MPIHFGNSATLSGDGSSLTIADSGANTLYKRSTSTYGGNTYGLVQSKASAGVPAFVAGSSDTNWRSVTDNWRKANSYMTLTTINQGGHYNTSTTRFTAPFAGPYYFAYTVYMYTSNYEHPQFYVNGSGAGAGRYDIPYRIRQYGFVANYQGDLQMEELINLSAGDYVEAYYYAGGTGYIYEAYGIFQGCYVG